MGIFTFFIAIAIAQEPGKTWNYTVQQNETLAEVSTRLYGTTRRWPELAKWNSLSKPYRLQTGQKLVLRRAPKLSPAKGRAAVEAMWRKQISARGLVRVEPGESLSEIALRLYGDASLWTRLAARNRIGKSDLLQPGQILMLPRTPKVRKKAALGHPIAPPVAAPVVAPAPVAAPVAAAIAEVEEPKSEELVAEENADQAFARGKYYFEKAQFKLAVVHLRRARSLNPKQSAAWIYEIKSLRSLKAQDSAKVEGEFLDLHPEMKALPLFRVKKATR